MMPKLMLQFEGRVLSEYGIGSVVTIGRLPDNTVVIENPAVSGHHARVTREGNDVILEDLESTNGTYVNDKHVTRHKLRDGDVILVGKHQIVFDAVANAEAIAVEPAIKSLGDTVYLDTQKHRALLTALREARAEAERTTGAQPTVRVAGMPPPPANPPVLRVVAGRAAQSEYKLETQTCLIGKSETALVRLDGWFSPKVAVAIARTPVGYVATRLGGKTQINGHPLSGRHELKHGDVLRVNGLTLEFRFEERVSAGGSATPAHR